MSKPRTWQGVMRTVLLSLLTGLAVAPGCTAADGPFAEVHGRVVESTFLSGGERQVLRGYPIRIGEDELQLSLPTLLDGLAVTQSTDILVPVEIRLASDAETETSSWLEVTVRRKGNRLELVRSRSIESTLHPSEIAMRVLSADSGAAGLGLASGFAEVDMGARRVFINLQPDGSGTLIGRLGDGAGLGSKRVRDVVVECSKAGIPYTIAVPVVLNAHTVLVGHGTAVTDSVLEELDDTLVQVEFRRRGNTLVALRIDTARRAYLAAGGQ